ncbi:MAG: hypothetical protein ABIQ01_09780 [Pseudolysinimonas sp.]
MTAALHPDYAAELALFGQLVGEWKVAHRSRTRGGAWTDSQRTWIFSWALNGRAVESVLLDDAGTEVGATMQVWDAKSGIWRITSSGVTGEATLLTGTAYGEGGIRQEGIERTVQHPDGRAIRWNFSAITPGTFEWDGWVADAEDGPNWEQQEHLVATRVR